MNLIQLKCGGCACESFLMYRNKQTQEIVSECSGCRSTTIITVTQPKIELKWGEFADGILAPFGKD